MRMVFSRLDGDWPAGLGRRALGRGRRGDGLLRSQSDETRGRGSGEFTGRGCREQGRERGATQGVARPAYESLVVAALHRSGGLAAVDLGYATRLAKRVGGDDRPKAILRVLGPGSPPEVAGRLLSRDGTVALVAVPLSTSFVAPATQEAVAWLQSQARAAQLDLPEGLEVRWAGDALIGRDYMSNVRISLHRAAVATVVLLLGVLFAVYHSVWLALVPMATIGISLVISRSVLAWMTLAGCFGVALSAAPKGPKQESPGGGNPACGVGPGDLIRMKIRPALKGRNKILDHKPVLPLQGVAILNTRSDSQGGALGWHVAAPSGRDSRSTTSKQIMTPYPMAMQMRYLQALADVASDQNSTIIFPLPLELLGPFLKGGRDGAGALVGGRPEDASPGVKEPAQSEKLTGVGATPVTAKGNGR